MENEKIIQPPAPAPIVVQTPLVSSTSPKTSKRLMILVILFIIIAVVGLGVYIFVLKYAPLPPNFPPQPTPLAVAQPTPTPDPTADWKTYTNTIDKFSFKYSTDWKVITEGGDDPEKSNIIAINNICNYESGEVCVNIDISYIPAPDYKEGQNISEYFDTHIKEIDRTNSQKIRVDNADALLTLSTIKIYGQDWENPFYIIEAIKGKKALWINYGEQAKEKQLNLKYKQTFDQILSTFKFIDQSPNISNQACGGPLAVEPNQGCPVGYSCGDITTAGGETSGKCLKN